MFDSIVRRTCLNNETAGKYSRIRKTTALAEDTVFLALPMRLSRMLQDLAELFGRDDPNGVRIEHGLSQQELAESVGSSREAVNRLLSGWQQCESL